MAGRGVYFLFFFFLITTYYSFSESSPHVLFQCNQECWKGSLGKVIEDIITRFLRFSVGLWFSTGVSYPLWNMVMVSVDLHMCWASPRCRDREERGSGVGEESRKSQNTCRAKNSCCLTGFSEANATRAEVKAPRLNSSSHREEQSDYGTKTVLRCGRYGEGTKSVGRRETRHGKAKVAFC